MGMIEKLAFITYEQHKKLVQTIVAEILSIDTVNGCMLIGSVSRGDAYPDSDLDLSLKHFLIFNFWSKKGKRL